MKILYYFYEQGRIKFIYRDKDNVKHLVICFNYGGLLEFLSKTTAIQLNTEEEINQKLNEV